MVLGGGISRYIDLRTRPSLPQQLPGLVRDGMVTADRLAHPVHVLVVSVDDVQARDLVPRQQQRPAYRLAVWLPSA